MREQIKFWVKVKKARIKYLWNKFEKEAKRITVGVVIMEFMLVAGYALVMSKGLLEPKIVIIEVSQAKTASKIEVREEQKDNSLLMYKIYRLESSAGLNDSCKAQGKINGYGYAQNVSSWKCFDSLEEVESLVDNWINEHKAQGLTEDEILCHYNVGTITDNCAYALKAKTIK